MTESLEPSSSPGTENPSNSEGQKDSTRPNRGWSLIHTIAIAGGCALVGMTVSIIMLSFSNSKLQDHLHNTQTELIQTQSKLVDCSNGSSKDSSRRTESNTEDDADQTERSILTDDPPARKQNEARMKIEVGDTGTGPNEISISVIQTILDENRFKVTAIVGISGAQDYKFDRADIGASAKLRGKFIVRLDQADAFSATFSLMPIRR